MRRFDDACSKAGTLVALVGVLVAVGALDCEDGSPAGPNDFEVIMINNDDMATHLFAPGEDFPDGFVLAGSRRTTRVAIPGPGVFFRAGRSGEILGTVLCGPVEGNDGTGIVLWAGDFERLTCTGGFGVL